MSYADTYGEVGPPGELARVRAIDDDGRIYIEFRNGLTGTVDNADSDEVSVGNVLLVHRGEGRLELVPETVWPEESWVGVVKLCLEDVSLIDGSGRIRMVPNNPAVDVSPGNTVEVRDSTGVVRVLAEQPIRWLEDSESTEEIIAAFKATTSSPNVSFDQVGGLRDVIARARELVEVPLAHREELATIGARPVKGVLFTGPPGTGKTMVARIIAHRSMATFYEVSGPEVFSKWYGQSERILRELFRDAARQERAVVFFDEIDSVAGQRSDEAHEASKRVVAQLLTLMDGVTTNENVVVIATTNRPQDIDVALRRPGRFDWTIQFRLPDPRDREHILRVSAARHKVVEPLPHRVVAARTEGWSGAELAAIWTEAALLAVTDERSVIVPEDYFGGYERVASQRSALVRTVMIGGRT